MRKTINPIQVAVGLIKNSQGQVLVARRSQHQPFAGKFEFPGGKMNPNENAFSALVRELQEELGITVKTANFLFEVPFDYEKMSVCLHVWSVENYEGEPHGAEGQEIFWQPISTINPKDFLHANSVIIDYLTRTPSPLLGEGC